MWACIRLTQFECAIVGLNVTCCPAQYEKDKEAEATKQLAHILYDTALLESGFAIEAPKDFNMRVHTLLASSLGIKGEMKVPVEPEEVEVGHRRACHQHCSCSAVAAYKVERLPGCVLQGAFEGAVSLSLHFQEILRVVDSFSAGT